jgi:hypothetical protein
VATVEPATRLAAEPRTAARLPALAWIAGWWLAGRGLVFAAALAVHALGLSGHISRPEHPLGALEAWDGRWYRMVASGGYLLLPGRQSDPAFFPLFPILLRGGHALGLGYYTAGIVIANAAFLAALVCFYVLTRELLDDGLARRATIYLAIFPGGVVFSMVYPESLVLALIALAVLCALRERWLLAAVCAAAAALGRPEAVFVSLPLLALAWQRRRALTPLERGFALGAVLAAPAAIASFMLYLGRVLHDPFAWTVAQGAWGRRFSPYGFVTAFSNLGNDLARNAWVAREVVAVVLYLALIAVAVRTGVKWPWTVGATAIVLLPLFSGAFDSVSRFGLLAPALFWGLAALGRPPAGHRLIVAASTSLLVVATLTLPYMYP